MKEKEDEVAGCYESYIKTGGTEEGKLDVRFEFDGTGRVSNLKVDSKSLKDPKLLSCFRTKLSDLKVDPSSTGKVVKIYYPIFVRITK
ncbi:MAG: AgmX/PglI C-terminal domain-containing protein [Proteobacteria bacterium]|nr:MAG: AgmX/PglI C-terminal domain-containing protein [Pseudomonadota bacterium]